MNKDFLKLFSIAILFFATLEQKCSGIRKYLELIPEGKIKESCEKFPKDPGACFFADLFCPGTKGKKSRAYDVIALWAAKEKALEEEKRGLPINDEFHIVRGEE